MTQPEKPQEQNQSPERRFSQLAFALEDLINDLSAAPPEKQQMVAEKLFKAIQKFQTELHSIKDTHINEEVLNKKLEALKVCISFTPENIFQMVTFLEASNDVLEDDSFIFIKMRFSSLGAV